MAALAVLNRKTQYALRAVTGLALWASEDRPMSVATIAQRTGVPSKFLEQIVQALARARLVRTRRGNTGGCYLARPARAIRLDVLTEAINGPLGFERGARARGAPAGGDRSVENAVERLVCEVADGVRAGLSQHTVADLCEWSIPETSAIDFSI